MYFQPIVETVFSFQIEPEHTDQLFEQNRFVWKFLLTAHYITHFSALCESIGLIPLKTLILYYILCKICILKIETCFKTCCLTKYFESH